MSQSEKDATRLKRCVAHAKNFRPFAQLSPSFQRFWAP